MQFSRHVELSETVAAFFSQAQLAYQETTVRSLIRLRSISPDTRKVFIRSLLEVFACQETTVRASETASKRKMDRAND